MTDPDPQAAIANRALDVGYKAALAITRDPALSEDIAQDVAITALTRGFELRNPNALNRWLYRTATNKSIDAIRRRDRQRDTDRRYASDRSMEQTHELDPDLQAVVDLLEILPPQQRAAMMLRYVFDLSDRDIARAMGCRASTARSWLARATATLRLSAQRSAPEDPAP